MNMDQPTGYGLQAPFEQQPTPSAQLDPNRKQLQVFCCLSLFSSLQLADHRAGISSLSRTAQAAKAHTSPPLQRTSNQSVPTSSSQANYRAPKIYASVSSLSVTTHLRTTHILPRTLVSRQISARYTRIYQPSMLRGVVMGQRLLPRPWRRL